MEKLPSPSVIKSNVIISQCMDGTFSQELLHIFQFDDINQKFTAILILVKSISGVSSSSL